QILDVGRRGDARVATLEALPTLWVEVADPPHLNFGVIGQDPKQVWSPIAESDHACPERVAWCAWHHAQPFEYSRFAQAAITLLPSCPVSSGNRGRESSLAAHPRARSSCIGSATACPFHAP